MFPKSTMIVPCEKYPRDLGFKASFVLLCVLPYSCSFVLKTFKAWIEAFAVTLKKTELEMNESNSIATIMTELKATFALNSGIKSLVNDFVEVNKVVRLSNYFL